MSKYHVGDAFQIIDPKVVLPIDSEGVVFVLVKQQSLYWIAKFLDYDKGHNCFKPELFGPGESGWFVCDSDIDECCVQIFDFENQTDILPVNIEEVL